MSDSHGVGRSNTPDTKIQAAGAAGAASVLIVWLVGQFGVEMPPEAGAALATLLAFVAGYFKRETTAAGGGAR